MTSFLDYEGLKEYDNNNKNYINEKIPTLVAGNNITLTTDTDTNEITISSTGGGEITPVTYELSKSGSTITLTGSDGTTSSVADSNTNTTIKLYRGNNGKYNGDSFSPSSSSIADIYSAMSDYSMLMYNNSNTSDAFYVANSFMSTIENIIGTSCMQINIYKINGRSYGTATAGLSGGTIPYQCVFPISSAGTVDESKIISTNHEAYFRYTSTEPTNNLSTNMVWIG